MKNNLSLLLLLCFLTVACHTPNKHPIVSTLAGTGEMRLVDGKAAEASFANLMGLTVDAAGNVYVADSQNNVIRKISRDGYVVTLAGSGAKGSADDKGRLASFFYPKGLAVDQNGNVYVSDTHNNLIRKIDKDGVVTTIAGRRTVSGNDGLDTTAVRFDNPAGIAVDWSGNVYVADWANDVIRKIEPSGKVIDLAGSVGERGSKDGIGASASFYLPWGVALDSLGNVYVADSYNNMIRKISTDGNVTTLAGKKVKGFANGKGRAASFLHPAGIALDPKGNVYVADVGNHRIRKISPDGMVTTFAGSGLRGAVNGRDTVASFDKPYSVAVDKAGSVYVADYQNNLVRKISF